MKKICVVTGSRAEYGLLQPLMEKIKQDQELILQVIATGMHLSPEFGLTYKQIQQDEYEIDAKIECLLSADTQTGVTKSIGMGMIGFADAYERLLPDMIILLGDRFEILAAATAALVARIPISHLHGGELTEGAIDDAIRHAITKMSHLHFTSTEVYRKRVIQLGENSEHVYNVGALGVENIKTIKLLSQEELQKMLEFDISEDYALITFHPVTIENNSTKKQFQNLLNVLGSFKQLKLIFTKANADAEGRSINQMIDTFVDRYPQRAIAFASMGQIGYLSALKYCKVVIGNSSSGIIEAPSFNKPVVNIGDRQKGRVRSGTVLDCKEGEAAILKALTYALSEEFEAIVLASHNPYEGKQTSSQVIKSIKKYLLEGHSLKKKFYDR